MFCQNGLTVRHLYACGTLADINGHAGDYSRTVSDNCLQIVLEWCRVSLSTDHVRVVSGIPAYRPH